jgi:hypothetical protein
MSQADWDEWIDLIRLRARTADVWEYVDPSTSQDELPRLLEPVFPKPSNVKSGKTSYAALSEDEKDELRILREGHRSVEKEYKKQKAALTSLRSYITSVVARNINTYILGIDSVYETLVALKGRVAPTDSARQLYLSTQYAKVKTGPKNQNFEVWLQEWEKTYNDCKKIDLPDVQGDRAIRDFLMAVEPVSPNWALTWRVEFDKHDWAEDHVISISRLVEIYRNYRRLEAAQQKNRDQFGANAASFKDEAAKAPTSSRKKDTPTCYYCEDSHWFPGCPYINELARPKDWKPDRATAKKVEERIASAPPWYKQKIEMIRKQALDQKEAIRSSDGNQKVAMEQPDGIFAVHQVGARDANTDYQLRDSVILDSATNVHVINDRLRFVDELRPSKDFAYAGTAMVPIEGIGTAEISIQTPSGPRKILLAEAAYVPDFHTNLACLKKFNDKNVWWDNEKNLLYKNDHETFAYCEHHCNQPTLEYNEPRPRTLSEASFDPIPNHDEMSAQEELDEMSDQEDETSEKLDETSDEVDETLDEIREDIGGSRQVDFDEDQDQATDQKELGSQDDDVISPQASKDDFLPELLTPDLTPEQTPEPTPEPPTPDETPAEPSGPLTRRTTRPEVVPEEQTRETYRVYVDDIVAICRKENVLKLQLFKEELMKKYQTTRPEQKLWLNQNCINKIDWRSTDCLNYLHHLLTY